MIRIHDGIEISKCEDCPSRDGKTCVKIGTGLYDNEFIDNFPWFCELELKGKEKYVLGHDSFLLIAREILEKLSGEIKLPHADKEEFICKTIIKYGEEVEE